MKIPVFKPLIEQEEIDASRGALELGMGHAQHEVEARVDVHGRERLGRRV